MTSYSDIKGFLKNMKGQTDEIVWARVWDDTKKGIEWMDNLPSISPGRWAVGYNYIYVITRILNEMHPQTILDLGLGISSTIISHYCDSVNGKNTWHDIVEQDKEWVSFYTSNNKLSERSRIHLLECSEKEYKGFSINYYKKFDEAVRNKKYNLISIDGPKGSKRFSRRDIVDYLSDVLAESFVILIDDSNRIGEKDTIGEIKKNLEQQGIDYYVGTYESTSDCCVIASANNKFFCSL